ncbi:MAG TPA: nuclear transport factor 2 family protein [Caulobacteraceae bacterium]|jgi:hypothetical protein
MSDFSRIARDYIALWNETDATRRARLLGEQWTRDATYVDPLAKAAGPDEIGAYIGGVHQRFPDFRFALLGEAEGHGDHLRFSWSLGPAAGEAPIEGSDVVTLQGERIAGVIGFLDKVPQPA